MTVKFKYYAAIFSILISGIGICAITAVCSGDPTASALINTTGNFGDDPEGSGDRFDRPLMMTVQDDTTVHPRSSQISQGTMLEVEVIKQDIFIDDAQAEQIATAELVDRGQSEILVSVSGDYVGGSGSGGDGGGWTTEYNRGSPRVALEINGDGASDNIVSSPGGAVLRVSVFGGQRGDSYSVSLTSTSYNDTNGKVQIDQGGEPVNVTVTVGEPVEVPLEAIYYGEVEITGYCSSTNSDTIVAEIPLTMEVTVEPQGVENPVSSGEADCAILAGGKSGDFYKALVTVTFEPAVSDENNEKMGIKLNGGIGYQPDSANDGWWPNDQVKAKAVSGSTTLSEADESEGGELTVDGDEAQFYVVSSNAVESTTLVVTGPDSEENTISKTIAFTEGDFADDIPAEAF